MAADPAGVVGAADRDPAHHRLDRFRPVAFKGRLRPAWAGMARPSLARTAGGHPRFQQPRPDRQHPVAYHPFGLLQITRLRAAQSLPQPGHLRPHLLQDRDARAIVHPDALPWRSPAAWPFRFWSRPGGYHLTPTIPAHTPSRES